MNAPFKRIHPRPLLPVAALILTAALLLGWTGPVRAAGTTANGLVAPQQTTAAGKQKATLGANDTAGGPVVLPLGDTLLLNGKTLTIFGDLTVAGNLDVGGGKLLVHGNLFVDGGTLTMTQSAGQVEVDGAFVADGADENGKLTAGQITVHGDFLQLKTHSAGSYCATGSHKTVLTSANKLVQFASPEASAIRVLSTASGTTFTSGSRTISLTRCWVQNDEVKADTVQFATTGGTVLSLAPSLSANFSLTAPHVYLRATMNGYAVSITGETLIPTGSTLSLTGNLTTSKLTVLGTLNLGTAGRTLKAGGDITVRGAINGTAAATIDCGGTFTAASGGKCALSAGTFNLRGAFNQASGSTFTQATACTTQFFAKGAKIIFATPAASYFGSFTTGTGAAIAAGSHLSLRETLPGNFSLPAGCDLTMAGSVSGRVVNVGGTLTVPAGQTLSIGSGRVTAGAMVVDGTLNMNTAAGVVRVTGAFTAKGGDETGQLTAGWLILEGSFTQKANSVGTTFLADAGHKTLLLGHASQPISFQNPGDSHFGTLYVVNSAVATPTGQPSEDEVAVAPAALTALSVSSASVNAPLWPAFKANTASYEALIPYGQGSATVAYAAAPGQSVRCTLNGAALSGWDGTVAIDPRGTRTVALTVTAACGLPTGIADTRLQKGYTLALQPVNPELSSLGLTGCTANEPADFAGRTAYTATLPLGVASATLNPKPANPNATVRMLVGSTVVAAPLKLAPNEGKTVTVTIEVTARHNGGQPNPANGTRRYTLTVRRPTLLDNISVATSYGDAPTLVFNRTTANYTLSIPAAANQAVLTAQRGSGFGSLTINGKTTDSVTLTPPIGGSAQAVFVAQDSTGTFRRTYTVIVRRAALVTGLTVKADGRTMILEPTFSPTTIAYNVDLPLNVAAAGLRIPHTGEVTSATVDGVSVNPNDGIALPLPAAGDGTRTVTVVASCANGQQVTYRLTLRRPMLTGIRLSTGTFAGGYHSYGLNTIELPYNAASVVVTPQLAKGVTLTNGGRAVSSITFKPAMGATASATLVTHYGGQTQQIALRVHRARSNNPALTSLGQSTGYLSPAFKSATTAYTLTIPETTKSLKFTPKAAVSNSVWKVGSGKNNTATAVSLPAVGKSSTYSILCTAQDGTARTYRVTVKRIKTITGLSGAPVYSKQPTLSPGGSNKITFTTTIAQPAKLVLQVRRSNISSWSTLKTVTYTTPGSKAITWNGMYRGSWGLAGTYYLRVTPYVSGVKGTVKTLTFRVQGKPSLSLTLGATSLKATGANKLKVTAKWTAVTNVTVSVLNSSGTTVRTLTSKTGALPGSIAVYWDGRDSKGSLVKAGTYRVKISGGRGTTVLKSVKVTR